jgi:hypothetical protein
MPIPEVFSATTLDDARFDAVVLVSTLPVASVNWVPEVEAAARADASFGKGCSFVAAAKGIAGGRLVLACTGPLIRDFGEFRGWREAR